MPSTVDIQVDCENVTGKLRHIWTSIGFDEINWSYTERGQQLLQTLKDDVMEKPYYIRNHNTFTSGNGLSYPAGGSTNIYSKDENDNAIYNFELIDRIYDNYVCHNCIPIVELGFMPLDLVTDSSDLTSDWQMGRDVGRETYELNKWKLPPKDYEKWQQLVETFARHLHVRYGQQVENWCFEVWNEPNLTNYWLGSIEDYCQLYDYSVEAIKTVNRNFRIGGPATSDVGVEFLRHFLKHVTSGRNHATNQIGTSIDFISFHTKGKTFAPTFTFHDLFSYERQGAYYTPRRCYNRKVALPSPCLSKMINDIRHNLSVCHEFATLNHLPIFVDECDPAVGTIYGIYDNPNYVVCNTEYYPCMVAAMIYQILSLSSRLELITHWSFCMEGKRLFEGNRTLVTNHNLYLPILCGLKLLGKLQFQQVSIERTPTESPVHAIATCAVDRTSVQLLLFYHVDDWTYEGAQSIDLTLSNVPFRDVRLKHYRIDASHSNTYAEWVRMGKPDILDANQLAHLADSQQLELLHDPVQCTAEGNQLKSDYSLYQPMPFH